MERYSLHAESGPRPGETVVERGSYEDVLLSEESSAIGLNLAGHLGESLQTLTYRLRERQTDEGPIDAVFLYSRHEVVGAYLFLLPPPKNFGAHPPYAALNDRDVVRVK